MPRLRREQIFRLRKQGSTYQEIGDFLGLSKQRVHQIESGYVSPLKKRGRLSGVETQTSYCGPDFGDLPGLKRIYWNGQVKYLAGNPRGKYAVHQDKKRP